ncbi:MAG: radical SAM protein [Promethearchaeota archaeon]
MVIEKIRVSIGSASVLGLNNSIKLKNLPTTCYLMTYKKGHCSANCGFCPQAKSSDSSTEKLSRVSWPIFPMKDVISKLKLLPIEKNFQRVCIQTLNYPENYQDIIEIVSQIRSVFYNPISVAIPPITKDKLKKLKEVGVSQIGIALDGTTPEIFNKIKGKDINGPYEWDLHYQCLREALGIFSKGFVSTHLIVGFGETHKEILKRIEELHDLSITVSLFAFTPVKGTKFENIKQPEVLDFRKIQLGRYLIINNLKSIRDFVFDNKGNLLNINISKEDLRNYIENSDAFMTSGCPGCNRPYYTSRPSGPTYNYPRKLKKEENEEIFDILEELVN